MRTLTPRLPVLLACATLLATGCSTPAGERGTRAVVRATGATEATPRTATASPGRPTGTPAAATPHSTALVATPYERGLLRDGARAVWPLRDVENGLRYGDRVADLRTSTPAVDVDGAIDHTDGPRLLGAAAGAAEFTSQGRLVTSLQDGFSSSDAFTMELWFRADGCTNGWGRAAGTESASTGGREGVSMFFYPRAAQQPCRLGVEIWHQDHYEMGCPHGMKAPRGSWVHLAASYGDGTLSCYLNGRLTEQHHQDGVQFAQQAPFGIGSAGTGVAGSLSSGSIAQVAVYASVLPATVLASHAAALQ